MPGKIGRYELRRELGRGAMGIVYEAHDPLLQRTVALKTIRLSPSASADERSVFEGRFFAEARIAAGLSHPAIVVVHDVGQDAETGQLFIAMEYLEGRALSDILRSAPALPWREALQLSSRIAEALHYAHARGVVHRDIKPANVMVTRSGEPKILDFGIAKSQLSDGKLTIAGQSVGTPLYSSPEQALGLPVDGRSDLFSLGAIAYSLLTGRAAFAAPNLTAVVERVIGRDPEPPSSLVPELPPAVDQLVARALAKDPAARYPDGAAFAADVAAVLAGREATAEGTSPEPAAPSELRRLAELASRRYAGAAQEVESPLAELVEPLADERTQPLPGSAAAPLLPAGAEVTIPPAALVVPATGTPATGTPVPQAGAAPPAVALAPPAVALAPSPAGSAGLERKRPRSRLGLALGGLAVTGSLITAGALVVSGKRGTPKAAALTATTRAPLAGADAPRTSGEAPRAAAREAVAPRPAKPSAAPAARERGRLAIVLENPPRVGGVRVWVDRKLVSEQNWSLTREQADSPRDLRFGAGGTRTLRLDAGGHDVEVEVAWDGKRSRERIWGELRANATRRLRAKIGGLLKKNLSLDWE